MKNLKFLVFILFCSVILGTAAGADTPSKFGYEGRLADSSGNAITNQKILTFKIFNALTGGTAIWTSGNYPVTPDSNGIFNIILGSQSDPITYEVFSAQPRYLEVKVEDETLSPRTQILSVGYALEAANAERLGGVSSSSYFLTAGGTITGSLSIEGNSFVTGFASVEGQIKGTTANFTGKVTAEAYYGDGSNLTGISTSTSLEGLSDVSISGLTSGESLVYNAADSKWHNQTAAGSGTITGVTAAGGLSGGGTSGTVTVSIEAGGVTAAKMATNSVTSDAIASGAVSTNKIASAAVGRGKLNTSGTAVANQFLKWDGIDMLWATPEGSGTITSIEAGPGLTGGGSSGNVTLSIEAAGITGDMLASNIAINTSADMQISDSNTEFKGLYTTNTSNNTNAISGLIAYNDIGGKGKFGMTSSGFAGGAFKNMMFFLAGSTTSTSVEALAFDIEAQGLVNRPIIFYQNVQQGQSARVTINTSGSLEVTTSVTSPAYYVGRTAHVINTSGDDLVFTDTNTGSKTLAQLASGTSYSGDNTSITVESTVIRIKTGGVTAGAIATNAVTSDAIATNAVATAEILAGAVTQPKLGATNSPVSAQFLKYDGTGLSWATPESGGTYTGDNVSITVESTVISIKTGGVTAGAIAADAVTSAKIAASAVGTSEIAANAVSAEAIHNNSISSAKIIDGSIVGGDLASNISFTTTGFITSESITFNSLSSVVYITADASGNMKLYDSSTAEGILLKNIGGGSGGGGSVESITATAPISRDQATGAVTISLNALGITSGFIGPNAVTAAKIGTGVITADAIATNAVTSGAIASGAVDTDEIATNAVATAEILAGAVTTAKFAGNININTTGTITAAAFSGDGSLLSGVTVADGSITTSKIVDANVTAVKLATGAVTAGAIATGAVTSGAIAANTITAADMGTASITADAIATGAVTSGAIATNAVATAEILAGAVTTAKLADNLGITTSGNISAETIYSNDWITAESVVRANSFEVVAVGTYIGKDASNNMAFRDAVTGTKTLAQLAAGATYTGDNTSITVESNVIKIKPVATITGSDEANAYSFSLENTRGAAGDAAYYTVSNGVNNTILGVKTETNFGGLGYLAASSQLYLMTNPANSIIIGPFNGTGVSEGLKIYGDGKVGINTDADATLAVSLEVAGSLEVSGAVSAEGGLMIGTNTLGSAPGTIRIIKNLADDGSGATSGYYIKDSNVAGMSGLIAENNTATGQLLSGITGTGYPVPGVTNEAFFSAMDTNRLTFLTYGSSGTDSPIAFGHYDASWNLIEALKVVPGSRADATDNKVSVSGSLEVADNSAARTSTIKISNSSTGSNNISSQLVLNNDSGGTAYGLLGQRNNAAGNETLLVATGADLIFQTGDSKNIKFAPTDISVPYVTFNKTDPTITISNEGGSDYGKSGLHIDNNGYDSISAVYATANTSGPSMQMGLTSTGFSLNAGLASYGFFSATSTNGLAFITPGGKDILFGAFKNPSDFDYTFIKAVSIEASNVEGKSVTYIKSLLVVSPEAVCPRTSGTPEGAVWYDVNDHKLKCWDATQWQAFW